MRIRPRAGAFDSLATLYHKGWLTWIHATKGWPEVRTERISHMAGLVRKGRKPLGRAVTSGGRHPSSIVEPTTNPKGELT